MNRKFYVQHAVFFAFMSGLLFGFLAWTGSQDEWALTGVFFILSVIVGACALHASRAALNEGGER